MIGGNEKFIGPIEWDLLKILSSQKGSFSHFHFLYFAGIKGGPLCIEEEEYDEHF